VNYPSSPPERRPLTTVINPSIVVRATESTSAETMRFITIVAMLVFAGIVYGILHDQVTARVCVEYFTVGHPPPIPSRSPTLLALAWGIVAAWFALSLGVGPASSARLGERPRLAASQLKRSSA
jgi:hypothetical protein